MAFVAEDDSEPDKHGPAIVNTPEDSESNESQTEPAVDRSLPRDAPVYQLYCYGAVAG